MKIHLALGLGLLSLFLTPKLAALNVSSDFTTNPFTSGWTFGVGNNSNNQFTWDQTNHALDVHVDSSLPTARLDLSLGTVLNMNTDFTITSRFSFTVTTAASDEAMQFAFGLVNHSLSGGDRTGSSANFGSDNVFNSVEFNYFPNVSPTYGTGRTLTPAVFGAQSAGGDAFSNFASVFGSGSDLGDNVSPAINALPQSTLLQATLNYSASTQLLTLTLQQVNGDSSLTTLQTGVPALSLASLSPGFSVDSLAIMAYHDGFNGDPNYDPNGTALVGDMAFQQIGVTSPAPEPGAGLLLIGSVGGLALFGRLRPKCRPGV
jgi:hypothetical protein